MIRFRPHPRSTRPVRPHVAGENPDAHVQALSREMECVRAALVNAGTLRRWLLRRRLRSVMREKAALERRW